MTTKQTFQHKLANKTPFFYGWVIVFLSAFGFFFAATAETSTFSIFIDQFINEFGWSRTQVNTYFSLSTLISSGSMFIAGKYADKIGSKKIMIISAIVLAFALFFLSFLTGSLAMLFIGFLLGRMAGPNALSLSSSILAPHWFLKKRGLAVMLAGLGYSLGGAFFPKFNMFLISTYGWRTAFMILGVGVLVIFVPICLIFVISKPEDVDKYPDNVHEDNDSEEDIEYIKMDEKTSLTQSEALKSSAFWILFFSITQFSMIGTGVLLNILSIYREGGLSESLATTMMSIGPILGLGVSLLIGLFIDKIRKLNIFLAVLTLLFSIGTFIIFILDTPIEAVLRTVIGGIAGAGFMLTHKVIGPIYFGRKHLGGVSGVMSIAWLVGGAIGPVMFGYAYDVFGGYKEVILFMLIFPILSTISLLFCRIPKKRREYKW